MTRKRQEVQEAALPLREGEELAQFIEALSEGLRSLYGTDTHAGLRAIFGDMVILDVFRETPGGAERWTERRSFTRDGDGAFTFGEGERVQREVRVEFTPVSEVARLRNTIALLGSRESSRAQVRRHRGSLERKADAVLAQEDGGDPFQLRSCLAALRRGEDTSRFYSVEDVPDPTDAEKRRAAALNP